jgi:hypothetical protein
MAPPLTTTLREALSRVSGLVRCVQSFLEKLASDGFCRLQ